jgi:hypothetical protein
MRPALPFRLAFRYTPTLGAEGGTVYFKNGIFLQNPHLPPEIGA